MQIFEFHFNPPTKEIKGGHLSIKSKSFKDIIFDSFCYEPENIYEKRIGSLYMVGLLKNVLPQNFQFLDSLAKTIKENYYKTISGSAEKSLRDGLKKANELLEKIVKEGDVSWLGNLTFGVISLSNYELNFTKVGDLKIFLLRDGQLIDIDQKIQIEGIEPYPLKIFGNIVSGKLSENDVILILTKEISSAFSEEKILAEISKLSPFDPKKAKDILNNKREQLAKTSGICLLLFLTKEKLIKEKEKVIQKKQLMVFSFKKVFAPLFNFTVKIKSYFYFKKSAIIKRIKKPTVSFPKKLNIPALKINFPQNLLPAKILKGRAFVLNKKFILIIFLFLFLVLGFFIFQKKEQAELKNYQVQLNEIQQKTEQAETYLIIAKTNPQAEKDANLLFKESWDELSHVVDMISSFPSDFAKEVLDLKEKISQNLYNLNKLVETEEPELFFEFNAKSFIPQQIVALERKLYFFNPYSEDIFSLRDKNDGEIINVAEKFNKAAVLGKSIMFFSKPDKLTSFANENFDNPVSLQISGFQLDDVSSYQSNLYFLDKKSGEIIKYPYLKWGSPQLWLSAKSKKPVSAKSIAVDGSVWILTKENTVDRYYAGNFQTSLSLSFFPYPKEFSKIFTSSQLPYLYLLEPGQNRIIILNKSGVIVKQFHSAKFNNLLDFAVSENGKTIYLLNGMKVFRVSF